MILPGETIGILGGGQLARMICLDAQRMGYRTVVWSGTSSAAPVEGVADEVINKPFTDATALASFTEKVAVATVEFENIPASTLGSVEEAVPLRPSAKVIAMSQNRAKEKGLLQSLGIPCAPFAIVTSLVELEKAYASIGPDAVLKTAESGYDGKGQVRLRSASELVAAWDHVEQQQCVLEGFVDFQCELSVLVARGPNGESSVFPASENEHREHILDVSIVPARVPDSVVEDAQEIALKLVQEIHYEGILAVEFFVEKGGRVVVNELAPRPHNSGHFTMDGGSVSQFEQQVRAICGIPLGTTELLSPTVMLNLLGDMWHGSQPTLNTAGIFKIAGAKLHLYDKPNPSGMRKLGHVNIVGGSQDQVLDRADQLKKVLLKST